MATRFESVSSFRKLIGRIMLVLEFTRLSYIFKDDFLCVSSVSVLCICDSNLITLGFRTVFCTKVNWDWTMRCHVYTKVNSVYV